MDIMNSSNRKEHISLNKTRKALDWALSCGHCGTPILKDYDAILHHKIELTPQNANGELIATFE